MAHNNILDNEWQSSKAAAADHNNKDVVDELVINDPEVPLLSEKVSQQTASTEEAKLFQHLLGRSESETVVGATHKQEHHQQPDRNTSDYYYRMESATSDGRSISQEIDYLIRADEEDLEHQHLPHAKIDDIPMPSLLGGRGVGVDASITSKRSKTSSPIHRDERFFTAGEAFTSTRSEPKLPSLPPPRPFVKKRKTNHTAKNEDDSKEYDTAEVEERIPSATLKRKRQAFQDQLARLVAAPSSSSSSVLLREEPPPVEEDIVEKKRRDFDAALRSLKKMSSQGSSSSHWSIGRSSGDGNSHGYNSNNNHSNSNSYSEVPGRASTSGESNNSSETTR